MCDRPHNFVKQQMVSVEPFLAACRKPEPIALAMVTCRPPVPTFRTSRPSTWRQTSPPSARPSSRTRLHRSMPVVLTR